jgi:hypothetical protein
MRRNYKLVIHQKALYVDPELFINLRFSRKYLALYESTNLQGFNGSTVRRCGYDLGGVGGV